MADIEHVRVRYTGADPLDFTNDHQGIFLRRINPGDEVEVPAHEVAAWPDGTNDLWEVVKANAPAVRKAEKAATSTTSTHTQGAQT